MESLDRMIKELDRIIEGSDGAHDFEEKKSIGTKEDEQWKM